MKMRALIFFLLYCLSAGIRLYTIGESSYQSDEIHWLNRGYKIIAMLKKDPANATSHLAHPGIPPAFLMGAAQSAAKAYNRWKGLERGDDGYIERLFVSRVAMALLTAFIPAVLFCFLSGIFSPGFALFASLLVSFDPRLVGYCRYAHIDGALILFVLLSVYSYERAERLSSPALKILSGLCLGLAIATKPTAVFIVVGILLYKLIMSVLVREGRLSVISWSDLWALLVAFGVSASLHTRLWHHPSYYRRVLKMRFWPAGKTYKLGLFLNSHDVGYLLFFAVGVAAIFFIWRAYSSTSRRVYYHSGMALSVLMVLSLALYLVPAVCENLIRYWRWVATLSGMKHYQYDRFVSAPQYGYMGLLLKEVPDLILLFFIVGVVWIAYEGFKQREQVRWRLLVFLLSLAVVWGSFLSVSSKQTLRYLLPVYPFIYVISLYGMVRSFGRLLAQGSAKVALSCVVLFPSMYALFSYMPHPEAYYNWLSGGIAQAYLRGDPLPFAGQREAVGFLWERAKREDIYTTVVGGAKALEATSKALYPKGWKRLHFGFYRYYTADYLLIFSGMKNRGLKDENGNFVADSKPVFKHMFHGVPTIEIYRVPYPDYTKPVLLYASQMHRIGGAVLKNGEGKSFVRFRPGKDKPGYVLFNEGLRVKKGKYTVMFYLGSADKGKGKDAAYKAALIEFGGGCFREISLSELSTSVRSFELSCVLSHKARLQPRV
ncbi:MAG: phospholipid carrier-dependent glycosyltransferase, partial [Candidatus Dadabacteria bacterium]